jgi:hypothetical protein
MLQLMPFWLLAILVLGGIAGAAAIGWQMRKRREKGPDAGGEEDGLREGYVVSAVMGLLALLIGFTYSLAIDRFDTRRERVLAEANAIGTTYLRAQLLVEPHRTRISRLLTDYVDARIELAKYDPRNVPAPLAERNQRLVTDLWTATVASFPSIRSYDFSSAFLDSMNQVIELDAARQQARRSQVPSEIFLILLLYQFIAAGVIGYVLIGRGGQRTGVLLLFLFGMSLIMVIDIDRPVGGGIEASQEPMERLRASLKDWRPEAFDRFAEPAPAR